MSFIDVSSKVTKWSQVVIDGDKDFTGPSTPHLFATPWADANYGFRKSLTITGSTAGDQTNYQIKLTVVKASGVDAAGTVYLNMRCKDDFSDFRFYSNAGVLLDYWIENFVSGVSAVVWVEVDSILASPATTDIWFYYDYASAVSASNGTNTWIIFNDGSTLVGWTNETPIDSPTACSVAVAGGKIRVTPDAAGGASSHFMCNTATGVNSYRLQALIIASDGIDANNYQQGFVHKTSINVLDQAEARWLEDTNHWSVSDEAGGSDSLLDNSFDARIEHKYMLLRDEITSTSALYVDDVLKVTHMKAAWNPQYIGLHNYFYTGGAHWADYKTIFVGNYVSSEPALSAYGIEDFYRTSNPSYFGLSDLSEVIAGMAPGDIIAFDSITNQIVAIHANAAGTQLMTKGPGHLPFWGFPDSGDVGYAVGYPVQSGQDDAQRGTAVGGGIPIPYAPLTLGGGVDDSSKSDDATPVYRNNFVQELMGTNGLDHTQNPAALLFRNISIPAGVTITSAYIKFTAAQNKTDTPNLTIWGESAEHPASYGASEDFTARARTATSVPWNPGNWVTDGEYNSADFSAIIQELLNSHSVYDHGEIALQIWGEAGTFWNVKAAVSFNGNPPKAPTLYIEYSLPYSNTALSNAAGNKSGVGVLGCAMRFTGINIPANCIIYDAKIVFTCNEARSGQTVNSKIIGESDPAPVPYGDNEDFTARVYTAALAAFTPSSSWSLDMQYPTGDLTVIVQELYNAYGPYINGVMAFQWLDNGSGADNYHSAYSVDADPSKAPILVITYGRL
jgi:hypothetical protein